MIPAPDPDRVHGCLLGGAVGDALGAAAEFWSLAEIRRRLGPQGVTEPVAAFGHPMPITDDTQMSLSTAAGMIQAHRRSRNYGLCHVPSIVRMHYLHWLASQDLPGAIPAGPEWRLVGRPGLGPRRAPGATCLLALRSSVPGSPTARPNGSKGCGAVMRAAPVGLWPLDDAFLTGAEVGALTHGHPTGFLAAGAQALLVNRLARGASLAEGLEAVRERLRAEPEAGEVRRALDDAVALAASGPPAPEDLERLGGGWVAEEALAIAVCAALAAEGDFAVGVRMAVTHSGDSDSTGAMCGAILGTALGVAAIPSRWRESVELADVIAALAAETVGEILEGG